MNTDTDKYYVVAKGHNPGIYTDWDIVKENVKGFQGALHKSFKTKEEAEKYLELNKSESLQPLDSSKLHTLTNEQLSVIHYLLQGNNIALTGGGGVGKSYLLSVIYTEYPGIKKAHSNKINPYGVSKLPRIQLCALTGCAALLLGNKAKTIHSWAGIGIGKGTIQELFVKIRRNTKAMRNWLCTDILIIDEISMMTTELLDKLNQLGKKIRSNIKPFGGIQVVFVGDFYQLPPVNKGETEVKFAFESAAWQECELVPIELTEIQRQKDLAFQKILKEARVGELSKTSCDILSSCINRNWKDNKIRPTLLFPRRAEVEMINDSNLRALEGRRYKFKARLVYDGKIPEGFSENNEGFQIALKRFDAEAAYLTELELVKDAQVMMIANICPEEGLVNGSRGVVVGFCPATELPIVEFINGIRKTIGTHTWAIEDYEFVSRAQVPLRLAYAITIHKCVSKDTLLSLPGKGLVKIKDLECTNQENNTIYVPDSLQVSGICENKDIIEVYKGSVEDGIKFTTIFGYEITTSNRHPLLIFNKNTFIFEWKVSSNITKDDYIVLKKGAHVQGTYFSLDNIIFKQPYKKQITVPKYLNEEIGYFIGVMLGDGSINDKTYRFDLSGIDMDILNRCVNILKDQFNIVVKRHQCQDTRKTATDRIFFHSKQLIELFRFIGYNFQKADKKEIPDSILTSPISVQKAVIQGLYDTDGGVSKTCINYTTTSENMGKQIQQMLFNMNITVSRVITRDEIINKNWKKVYRLNMCGKSALKFVNEIGFKCERKNKQSHDRFYEKETLRKNNNSQSFEIPNGNKLINNLRNEIQNDYKRINSEKISKYGSKLLSSIINNKQKLRCDSLNVIINEIPNISQYSTGKLVSFIYNNGILIDTLRSIENVTNIQMYDIGVSPLNTSNLLPDGHDFIGNGFVNHNCQGSTLDAALIDIGSSLFEYGQAYVALSRVKNLDALYVYDFDPIAFKAHPKVKEFYKHLVVKDISDIEKQLITKTNIETIMECKEAEMKPIIGESSKSIQVINVIKEDCSENNGVDNGTNNWCYDTVPANWKDCLLSCQDKLLEISNTISTKEFLPSRENIWRALELTPLTSIKAVILGQDPYPTIGNAHGLAFSVLPDVRPIPASLKNIYKELKADVDFIPPSHGHLKKWAEQGVLLLNTVLTVEEGSPQSHSKIGWEEVTDQIIRSIAARCSGVVFVLWGKSAQAKKKLLNLYLDKNGHRVFESAHPSPLSASKGFFGSRPFSTVNTWLKEMGKEPIDWQI